MRWIVSLCTHPGLMWQRYESAIGAENMKAWYGDYWPPAEARAGETVYVWRDADASPRPFDPTDHPAAWLSLTRDQFDPRVCWMSRGVWPNQHGKGLGREMRQAAERWARLLECTTLAVTVHAANLKHLVNVARDDYWESNVVIRVPPAYGFVHALRPE